MHSDEYNGLSDINLYLQNLHKNKSDNLETIIASTTTKVTLYQNYVYEGRMISIISYHFLTAAYPPVYVLPSFYIQHKPCK